MKRPKPIQGIKGIKQFVTKRKPIIDEVVHETTSGGEVWRRNKEGKDEI
jgi:hypothetical protein